MQLSIKIKPKREMDERFHPPLPGEKWLQNVKNYSGITLTTATIKVYYAHLLNQIRLEAEKVPKKNQNAFRINRSTTSKYLAIR